MENLYLFVATVLGWLTILFFYEFMFVKEGDGLSGWKLSWFTKRIAVLALLCAPFNLNGNIWTVLGNAVSEKSIVSVFSVYQKADAHAITVFGLAGYQKAGHDAVTIFGLAGYQKAGKIAGTMLGLAGYQKAGRTAATGVGLAGYQAVPGKERVFGIWKF